MENTAREWIATDPESVRDDVERLGLDGAARYNYDLAMERVAAGDDRWADLTLESLREAMAADGVTETQQEAQAEADSSGCVVIYPCECRPDCGHQWHAYPQGHTARLLRGSEWRVRQRGRKRRKEKAMDQLEILEAMGNLTSDAEAVAMQSIIAERGLDIGAMTDEEFFALIPEAIEMTDAGQRIKAWSSAPVLST